MLGAIAGLAFNVSKEDFQACIDRLDINMQRLNSVIDRYNEQRSKLGNIIASDDSNYDAALERIETNIKAAQASYNLLREHKVSLEQTVEKMEGMGSKVGETLTSATDAAVSTIQAAINVQGLL